MFKVYDRIVLDDDEGTVVGVDPQQNRLIVEMDDGEIRYVTLAS